MNFVGHAMAARWEHDAPGFVLGAMLPDLARMCGARLEAAGDGWIAAGIACHHRADAAFHQAAGFCTLCTEARAVLHTAGVARGPALAAAHVGVELLLDGCWIDDPEVEAAYLGAVEHAIELPPAALGWTDEADAQRFRTLCLRLREAGAPRGYRDPAEVGRRLVRILSRRPRLAPAPGDEERLVRWARGARPGVIAAAPRLCAELRQGIVPEAGPRPL